MTVRIAASAALIAALAFAGTPAVAQDKGHPSGQYLSIQAGFSFLNSATFTGSGVNSRAGYEDGFAGALAFGHAYGNGVRVEAELARRKNGSDYASGSSASGSTRSDSLMVNGLYDFAASSSFVPYIGAGLGLARVKSSVATIGSSRVTGDDTTPAWQAMVGAAIPLGNGLEITADLRHFATFDDAKLGLASGTAVETPYRDNSVMLGLRWRFGAPAAKPQPEPAAAPAPAPAPAPVAQAAPAPTPAPAAPRSFLIFFDWDKSNIRPDAQKILEAAAAAAKSGARVSIQLTGHADRSGPTRYNQRLSERRANAAKAALVQLGLSANSIATVGRGESQPLVATADGVREPRNRRVEIQF